MIHSDPAYMHLRSLGVSGTCLCSLLCFAAMLSPRFRADAAVRVQPQQSEDIRTLVAQVPIERELSGGQTHLYDLTLAANQYVKIDADQRGVDVTLTLKSQDGKPLGMAENNRGRYGVELILWQPLTDGVYRLGIAARDDKAGAGRYQIRLETFVAQEDVALAFQKYTEAKELLGQRSAASAPQAVRLLEESLAAWRKLDNRQMEGLVLLQLVSMSTAAQSLKYSSEALPIFRSLGMKAEEARLLNVMGSTYRMLGNNTEAIRYLEEALSVGDYFTAASTLHLLISLGDSYWRVGETQKGLEYLNRALTISRESGNRFMELSSVVKIGEQYLARDDIARSAEYLNLGLSLARELKAVNYEGILLSFQGQLHLLAGDDQKALELFQQSLRLHQDPKSGNKLNAAERLMDIGRVYSYRGDSESAFEHYQHALSIFQSTSLVDGETTALSEIGHVYANQGQFQKSLDHLNKALTKSREIGVRSIEVSTLIHLADALEGMGNRQEALNRLDETLALCRSLGYYQGEAMALIRKARLARSSGDVNQARQLFESSLRASEERRFRFGLQELKDSYSAGVQGQYEEYTDLLMQLHKNNPMSGEDRIAFQTSERARARGLLELLAEARADIHQGADPTLVAKQRALQQRLNAKDTARREMLNSRNTVDQAAALAKEIDSLIADVQLVESQIRASTPRYAALLQPQPLSTAEVQSLLDENTVLLEFALGEKQSWVWAVTRGTLDSYRLPPRAEIESAARRVYELLTARQTKKGLITPEQQRKAISDADPAFREEAAALSQILIGPIASRLEREWKNKRLVIVASGALEYVPFAALSLPESTKDAAEQSAIRTAQPRQPLIADHEIVTLPSASVLALVRKEPSDRSPVMKTLAVLADPVFEANDPRVTLAISRNTGSRELVSLTRSAMETEPADSDLRRSLRSIDRGNLSRLPFSREEAEALASLVPAKSLLKATDFQASRAKATSGELSTYRIIHFATHGLLNSEHPELSGLVLSLVDENGKTQDGFLRMHELYNLRLPADLVVLSACQTGLGKEIKGEGLVGLTRGFMYAGAQRVVASLWQVDDLATAELMKRFYRGMLKGNLRPAASLRAAQLDLMKQKRWSSPYFWAAFVIQGDWK